MHSHKSRKEGLTLCHNKYHLPQPMINNTIVKAIFLGSGLQWPRSTFINIHILSQHVVRNPLHFPFPISHFPFDLILLVTLWLGLSIVCWPLSIISLGLWFYNNLSWAEMGTWKTKFNNKTFYCWSFSYTSKKWWKSIWSLNKGYWKHCGRNTNMEKHQNWNIVVQTSTMSVGLPKHI